MKEALYFECGQCGEYWVLDKKDFSTGDCDKPTELCAHCEMELCVDDARLHTCEGHEAVAFFCQGCGKIKDLKELAPKQIEHCVECRDRWEAKQEVLSDD